MRKIGLWSTGGPTWFAKNVQGSPGGGGGGFSLQGGTRAPAQGYTRVSTRLLLKQM